MLEDEKDLNEKPVLLSDKDGNLWVGMKAYRESLERYERLRREADAVVKQKEKETEQRVYTECLGIVRCVPRENTWQIEDAIQKAADKARGK